MDSEAVPNFGRTESIVIPFPGQPLDVSLDSPPDTATDNQRTTNGQNQHLHLQASRRTPSGQRIHLASSLLAGKN